MGKKKTTKEFIIDAKRIHGNKFDYSLVEYKGVKEKIKIICPNNHTFEQSPNDHLNNHGCKQCSGWGELMYSNDEFHKRLKQIHNDLIFINSTYEGWEIKTEVQCPNHGIFYTTPQALLNSKRGCPKCGYEKARKKNTWTQDKFIKEAEKIHNEKYNYSLSKYNNATTSVIIICSKHGEFLQQPKDHINQKQGCPSCRESKGENEISNILNELKIPFYRQHTFKECINKRALPFDFYLPDYNVCIEYDGEQHFTPVEKFGGMESFTYITNNDEIKNKFCKENNITLLRISYKEKKEIKQIINSLCQTI